MNISNGHEQLQPQSFDALRKGLSARRQWIALSALLFGIAGLAVAILVPSTYRASVVLIASAPDRTGSGTGVGSALGQLGGLSSLVGLSVGGSDAQTEEALAVLRSRQFTENFIGDRQLLPKLIRRRWAFFNSLWHGDADPPTLAEGYKRFDRSIRTVIEDKRTGLVTLQIDWRNRQEAADWANDLVRRLNSEMRERAVKKSAASLAFLEHELKGTASLETQQSINRLIEFQIRQKMLADVTDEYAFRVVDAALPPDAKDPVWPPRIIIAVAGPIVGFLFGAFLVLVWQSLRPPRL